MSRKPTPPSPLNLPAGQPFSGLEPGPLLHDFDVLLRALHAGLPVSARNAMPGGQTLRDLDARLRRPLDLQLVRLDVRSHPYLQALYLLAQAGNFVATEGKVARLNPTVAESWAALNDTERYFNLLEAALVHADPSMIGQRGYPGVYARLVGDVARLPAGGVELDLEKPTFSGWDSGFGEMTNLALADLFGLVETAFAGRPVKPWRPARIRPTAWGRAAVPFLRHHLPDLLDEDEWGAFLPAFGPAYPAYARALVTAPAVGRREGVYVFKVTLHDAWRRLALPHDETLEGLLVAVVAAFGFDNDHLHAFRFRDRGGRRREIACAECEESPGTDEVELAELPIDPGTTMELEFDFGDSWLFAVKLEAVEPVGAVPGKLPRVLERHGKAPRQHRDWDDE